VRIGSSHRMRKELFQRGIREGFLTLRQIDAALPPGTVGQGERWLLLYSLRAAGVQIRDGDGSTMELPPPPAE
jgi:hypothetical protein